MNKKRIMIILGVALLMMITGYAAFSSNLKINGTANIESNWKVLFTKIEEISKTDGVTVTTPPTTTGTEATFYAGFKLPGDKIIYQITLSNEGTLDAVIESIDAKESGGAIYFNITGIKKGDILNKKTSKIITIEMGYSNEVTGQPNDLVNQLELEIKCVQYVGQSIPSEDVTIEGPIITNLSGVNNVKLPNSAGRALTNYKIYGNTVLSGTPSPDSPSTLTYLGNEGSITVESINNLMKNGYGEKGDNTNFPGFTYSTDSPTIDIMGSFYKEISVSSGTTNTAEYIPIDPNKSYNYSAYAKNTGTGTDATYYMGLTEYDIDKKYISPTNVMYVSNTLTTLTKDLKDGDTIVYLDDISNFQVSSSTRNYRLGFIFWNYKDSTGYTYPELTYSRNVWTDLYTYDKVDKINNTITLKTPWNHGTIPKGTKLSQSSSGNVYNYSLLSSKSLSSTWTKYSATISGLNKQGSDSNLKFRPGTKYVIFLLLDNYNHKVDVKTHIAGVRLVESDYDNVETIDLSGHSPLRKVGNSADYIDYENKRIVRNTWEYTLTGNEEWTCSNNTSGNSINCYFNHEKLSNLTGGKIIKENSSLLSTHYPYTNLGQNNYWDRSGNGIYGYSDSSASFMITTNKATSVEAWKSYLKAQVSAGIPVKVLYELKTPIYESINLPSIGTGRGDSTFTVLENISPSNIELNYQKTK